MSAFAGVRPAQPVGGGDAMAQYVGLEQRVGGIEKTVDNLARIMRDENSQIKRDMADQNAGLRQEMAMQNAGVIAAIDKLSASASAGNKAMRDEFTSDLKVVSEKQGMKSSTLIALGGLGMGVLGFLINQNNRPTENAILDLKASVAKHEGDFVPRAQIDRMQSSIDRLQNDIVSRAEHEREWKLRDKISDLEEKITDQARARTITRLDEIDARVRSVEQKTAK